MLTIVTPGRDCEGIGKPTVTLRMCQFRPHVTFSSPAYYTQCGRGAVCVPVLCIGQTLQRISVRATYGPVNACGLMTIGRSDT